MNSDDIARNILKRLDRIAPQNVELPALMIDDRAYGISELRAMSEADRVQWGKRAADTIAGFIRAVDTGNRCIVIDNRASEHGSAIKTHIAALPEDE